MLDYNTYINKVKGCWMGKNIGGTLGAPLEGMNCEDFEKYYDYYLQDLDGKAFPNDDLDLQLVWLNAVEKYGKQLNSRILGEYWLSYIVPNFSNFLDTIFVGDGVKVYGDYIKERLGGHALLAPASALRQRASSIAMLAMEKAKRGETQSYSELVPFYLRKSQAERELEEKEKANKSR